MADDGGISLADALSLIGIVGGGALASRGGSIGTPLGIGAAGLGEFGLLYSQNKAERAKQQRLAAMLYNMKDPMGKPDPSMRSAATAMLSGANINDALKIGQTQQAATQQANLAQQLKGIAPATGPTEPVNIALPQLIEGGMSPAEAKTTYETMTGYTKPEKSPLDVDPEGNVIDVKPGMHLPKGSKTLSEFGKEEKPAKPRYDFGYDTKGKPVRINVDTGAETAVDFTKAAPKTGKPIIRSVGGSVIKIDPETFSVLGTIDPPKKVVDKNKWTTFAEGYLDDHPNAKGPEITAAYDKAEADAKPPKGWTPPHGLPKDYTPTPSPSLPGAVFLSPKPASGLLGSLSAPTTPLLYIPSTGKYVKPGEEVAPGVIWDGKP